MLNPTRPAQKNLSEEDSSGSDAGSEVSLEPGTDRFGFILTSGSTAGNVGPPPELVRQREAKWINIIDQWDHIVLKKTTSKVKVQCQKGIPASLRSRCWSLLCGAADRMKQNKNLYQSLDSQPALQSWVDVIERDLDRQFPFHEMFLSRDGHGQRGLFRVLKAYTQYQPEEGYCQAQGPVAAVLLMNMLAEEAFWCLVQISEQYLPGYYSPLLEGVLFDAVMLTWLLKRTCPAVHKHLQHYGVEPLMFATDWLMCLFTRHLPFNTLLRVWDLFFCYGVRVLFQVAVVLVRRVLGRAEQRKRCQGQMETLERLRGVREQVQEEDDAFIAEVCSVPLSARDLEKQTQKELQKWRKDRPSSTFDPRGRCQGYQMAWERIRENEKERDRKEREEGNLSVPQDRLAFRHSLSPSSLQKRLRKGTKVNIGDWEGGSKVKRNHSLGAKERIWNSWNDLHLKKGEDVKEEEELSSEEDRKHRGPELAGEREQKEVVEARKSSDSQITPTEHLQETDNFQVKAETLQMERTKAGKEDGKSKGKGESKCEQTQVEGESAQHAPTIQSDGRLHQPTEDTSLHKQGEALDSHPSQQSLNSKDEDIKDRDIKTQEVEPDLIAATEENQTETKKSTDNDTKKEVDTDVSEDTIDGRLVHDDKNRVETENVQQILVNITTDVRDEAEFQKRRETSGGSETGTDTEAIQIRGLTTETKIKAENVFPEASESSHDDAFDVKKESCESTAEMTEDTQTETENEDSVQCEKVFQGNTATQTELEPGIQKNETDLDFHTDTIEAEAETSTQSSPECFQQTDANVLLANTDNELDMPVTDCEIKPIQGETTQCSDKEGETTACENTQVKEEILLATQATVNDDTIICDQSRAEETPAEFQTGAETVDLDSPAQESSTQCGAVKLSAEPEETVSSLQAAIPEKTAPEKDTAEGEERVENVKENTGEDEVFIPPQSSDRTDAVGKAQVQNKDDCPLVQREAEQSNSKLKSGHRSSQSSGDICVRKSPCSRGKRSARRLSEDLFTAPQQIQYSQSICNYTNTKECSSETSNQSQSHAAASQNKESVQMKQEVTGSSEPRGAQGKQSLPDPPKRFGLFRRLRGEQPKKTKGTPTPKMQVPKILIQDFSDMVATEKPVEEVVVEEKMSSRERRRKRREQERRQKEEERLKKKREKDLEKQRDQERRKPQTRGQSFQVQREKSCTDAHQTGVQSLRYSASYAQSYF